MYFNCAVTGCMLADNIMPAFYAKFFSLQKINGGCSLFEVKQIEELPVILHFLERFNFRGINICYPFKQSVISYIQDIDPFAAETGSVDTLVMTKDGWAGYNFEHAGALEALKRAGVTDKSRVLLIGAGASAASFVLALKLYGIKSAAVMNRSLNRFARLQEKFPDVSLKYINIKELDKVVDYDVIINVSPIEWGNEIWLSHFWNEAALILSGFKPHVVIDTQYFDHNSTSFLDIWNCGNKFNGLYAAFVRSTLSFKLWLGECGEYSVKGVSFSEVCECIV